MLNHVWVVVFFHGFKKAWKWKYFDPFPIFHILVLHREDRQKNWYLSMRDIDDGTQSYAVRFSLINQAQLFFFLRLLPTCIAKMFHVWVSTIRHSYSKTQECCSLRPVSSLGLFACSCMFWHKDELSWLNV